MFKISVMPLVGAQSVPSQFPEFHLEAALLLGGLDDVDEGMIKGCSSFGRLCFVCEFQSARGH